MKTITIQKHAFEIGATKMRMINKFKEYINQSFHRDNNQLFWTFMEIPDATPYSYSLNLEGVW